jgi:Cu/Ag efflux pump CusA
VLVFVFLCFSRSSARGRNRGSTIPPRCSLHLMMVIGQSANLIPLGAIDFGIIVDAT